jgi:citrate synthase
MQTNVRVDGELAEVREGLEGVVVTATRLSDVDGERGRLVIAGHDVEALAGARTFEQVAALLFSESGEVCSGEELGRELADGRARAFERLSTLGAALSLRDGMDALRAAAAQLEQESSRAQIVAALAVFASAWARKRAGQAPIAPPSDVGHAEALLTMLGAQADEARVRALDAYLVTVIDHGLNASTFAARVVASTGSDRVSSVVAAIGALKGPLHGGAPGPVLDMLDAVIERERAHGFIAGELASGRRIMGMGHRIYRVRDPRACVLERAIEQLATALAQRPGSADVRARLTLARAVEREAEAQLSGKQRNIRANVEFYTAVLLEAIGVPRALFSPVFACARAAGWLAHVDEQLRHGRLIRPSSRYVGRPVEAHS